MVILSGFRGIIKLTKPAPTTPASFAMSRLREETSVGKTADPLSQNSSPGL